MALPLSITIDENCPPEPAKQGALITGVTGLKKSENSFSFTSRMRPDQPGQTISINHPCPDWIENGCVLKINFDPPSIELVYAAIPQNEQTEYIDDSIKAIGQASKAAVFYKAMNAFFEPYYEPYLSASPAKGKAQPRPKFLQRATKKEYPGTKRNEPCPCGSGKKYKVCHG